MTNLQKVTEACHKANPKLLELSFGCKVMWQDNEYDLNESIIIKGGEQYDYYYYGMNGEKYHGEDIHKIIGHDITLEDVLKTWESKLKETWGDSITLKQIGLNPLLRDIILGWDYGKPLHEQSEETISFLAGLL